MMRQAGAVIERYTEEPLPWVRMGCQDADEVENHPLR